LEFILAAPGPLGVLDFVEERPRPRRGDRERRRSSSASCCSSLRRERRVMAVIGSSSSVSAESAAAPGASALNALHTKHVSGHHRTLAEHRECALLIHCKGCDITPIAVCMVRDVCKSVDKITKDKNDCVLYNQVTISCSRYALNHTVQYSWESHQWHSLPQGTSKIPRTVKEQPCWHVNQHRSADILFS
jgi:hypothetical protein